MAVRIVQAGHEHAVVSGIDLAETGGVLGLSVAYVGNAAIDGADPLVLLRSEILVNEGDVGKEHRILSVRGFPSACAM